MKNVWIVLLVMIAILNACSKPCPEEEPCPTCPLSTGETCQGQLINVNDECVCPNDYMASGTGFCIDTSSQFNHFSAVVDCGCFSDLEILMTVYPDTTTFNAGFSRFSNGQVMGVGSASLINQFSNYTYFLASTPFQCNGVSSLLMQGNITNDTMYVNFMVTGEDTCSAVIPMI